MTEQEFAIIKKDYQEALAVNITWYDEGEIPYLREKFFGKHTGKLIAELEKYLLKEKYLKVLEKCQQGKFTEELKELYKSPVRETVPWDLFPAWARPTDQVEGCHEG